MQVVTFLYSTHIYVTNIDSQMIMIKNYEDNVLCPFDIAMEMLGGKWKFSIIYTLSINEKLRFKELERAIPKISTRMLVKELKDLTEKKIIKRTAYPTIPPKVEYNLTELGKTLEPVMMSISSWGEFYMEKTSE